MADDITLTVRVRDLTRGELNQLRNRLRGMDGDMRRLSQSSNLASDRARRLGQDLRGVSGRLGSLQRSGTAARHEMDFMRRSMGLMSRDLRNAARSGELTGDEFRTLQGELERTRLDFDRLDNQLRRHSAITDRARRADRELARAAQQRGRLETAAQREGEQRILRRGRLESAAQREDQARTRRHERDLRRAGLMETRALREAEQRVLQRGRLESAAQREDQARAQRRERDLRRMGLTQTAAQREDEERILRRGRLETAAQREDQARTRRAEAERRRAATAAAADLRRRTGALAGLGGPDQGLTLRFRALGENDMRRMTRGFTNLQGSIAGISGSTAHARRNVQALSGDLRTMSQVLRAAGDSGSLSRRDFNALSNGLRLTVRDARQLVRSGDMTRASFRDVRREVAGLGAQLRLLGRERNRLLRLGDGMLLLQRRMRDTSSNAGILRRSLSRMGEGAVGGMRPLVQVLGHMQRGFGRLREFVSGASRGMKMFLLVLGLLGPLAPAVGALLTTVLGASFVALGAFALRGEKDVKNAFGHMKSTIGVAVRTAAQPLRASLVVAMHDVTEAVQGMGGALTEAFSATAPLVGNLAGAFTDLASGALPGIVESLRDMGPAMKGFRDAMGSVGEGIGQMFAAMTAGGGAGGLGDTWRIIGDGIKDVLINIGEFINAMSQSETATALLTTAFGVLSSLIIVIEGAFKILDATIGPLIKKMSELGLTTGLVGLLASAFEALGISTSDTESSTSTMLESLKGTAASQNEAAVKTLSHAEALRQLNEEIKEHNNQNLNRFDAEASLNQAMQDATRNAKNYGNTVKINNGIFDTTHTNTRKVYQDFSKLAENTQLAVDAAIKAKQPIEEQNRLWKLGETNIRALGKAYGIPKAELDAFIALVLQTPEAAKTKLELDAEKAIEKATDLTGKIKKVDGFKAKVAASLEAAAAVREAGRLTALLGALNGTVSKPKVDAKTQGFWSKIREVIGIDIPGKSVGVGANTGGFWGAVNALRNRVLGTSYINVKYIDPGVSGALKRDMAKSADGNIFKSFADGGVENHVAQISSGTTRVWAEPETGGEAYIPLGPSKRTRSRSIAEQTIGMLGGSVEWFARGGTTKSEREARKDARGELTISAAGRAAGRKNTEFANALGSPSSLNELIGAINKWRSIIKKATHGGVEKSLLNRLSSAGKALMKYEKQHEKIAKTLEKAKAVRESVASGLRGEAGIVKSATSSESQVTINTLLSQMTASAANTKQFAAMLKDLRKRGVSKDIIKQIADAGIEGGGMETAAAILGGGKSEIKRLNDLQKKINASAKKAGNATADAMFGAGAKAAEGLIAGLEKKQKAIEKAMMKIAKSMEKAIKKALGIKSPSKVMEEVGHFTAEGFAIGMEKNRSAPMAWESMFNAPPSGQGTATSGRGGRPIVVHQTITLDGRIVARQVFDPLREEIAHRGGNVQQALGRG
mgnify:CR=1 FL=1